MNTLRVGIIGLGVGEQHIAGYQRHPQVEVTALCDFSSEKLALMQERYPSLKRTTQADDILEDPDIDVVSVATFDNYHHPQIIKALQNNKHVFVEKPLCLYPHEAREIRQLLNQNPQLRLSSNLILRRSPRFCLLKQMISQNELGELFYVEGDYNYGRLHKLTEGWRCEQDFYSVVYGGGVHLIDLMLWLTGDSIEEVVTYGNKIASRDTPYRYPDLVACLLQFKSGMVGKMTNNFGCVFPHFHPLSVFGTKATFVNGTKEALLYESRDPQINPRVIDAAYPGVHKGDLIYSFVDSILNHRVAEVTTEDVFRTMSVCFAIEQSLARHESVKVEYI